MASTILPSARSSVRSLSRSSADFVGQETRQVQRASFSVSSRQLYPRDRNPNRGVSAFRRTGLRHPLSVSNDPLPQPVTDPKQRSQVETDETHGLWQFFNADKAALATPEQDNAHGQSGSIFEAVHREMPLRELLFHEHLEAFFWQRAWTVEELRRKSWEDLHSLWWICAKERNRIATSSWERGRLKAGYGDYEANQRDETVRRTQRAVKHVLTERWYAWEDARKIAQEDETVDLSGDGPAFQPYKASTESPQDSK